VKLAFITPRYGAEIPAGPEHACRLLAEQVCERHDVDVLTTCARDPHTWKNEYSEGPDRVRGLMVRRFSVNQPYDRAAFEELSSRITANPHGYAEEQEWVHRLGPSSPTLIDYLKRHHRAYDAVVFFSLYHATTVHGLAAVPDRTVLFPYLRLDPALRFGMWTDVLRTAKAVGYLSGAERRLAHAFLRVTPAAEEVVGVGVEIPSQQTYPRHQQDPADTLTNEDSQRDAALAVTESADYLAGRGVPFRRRHRLYGSFVLYGGRVESDNGSEEMLDYFDTYAAADGNTALVLMGVKLMNVSDEPYLRMAGVLPDRERMVAYEAAQVTLAPEPDDLLAQTVVESLAVGTPVLASARNEAAVDLCRRSNGGLYYANRDEFVEALRVMLTNARLRERLGEHGRQYIFENHRWDAVLGRFERLVMKVRRS
jgi:glycosyltransferase involved in cell wall biosynthesis